MRHSDIVNQGIIDLLKQDGRISNKKIAQSLGVSEPTVAARIRALQASNTIRVVAQRSLHKTSESASIAMLELYVDDPKAIKGVGLELRKCDAIISAFETSRRPEVIAFCFAESPAALNRTILALVRRIPYLRQMNTLPLLSVGETYSFHANLRVPRPQRTPSSDLGDRLLALLEDDGRQSVRMLANKLGLSETAVRARLAKLRRRPGIRIGVVHDSISLGYGITIDLRLTIEPAHLETAIRGLCKRPGVEAIAHLAGEKNLLAFVILKSIDDGDQFIEQEIRPLKGLLDFSMTRVRNVIKHNYNILL